VRAILSCVVLATLVNTAFADSSQAKAKRHIAKADKAYKAGKYEDARKEYATAYSLDPQPKLLFVLGEINVKLEKCEAAITFLQKYLESNPEESEVGKTNEQLKACNAPVEEPEPVPEPTQPPPSAPPIDAARDNEVPDFNGHSKASAPVAVPTAAVQEGPSDRPWILDPAGLALCGGGVLAGVAAGVLYTTAISKNDEAATKELYDDALALAHDASTLRTISIVSAGVGVALLGAGAYIYYSHRNTGAQVTAMPTTHGGMIGLAGRF